MLGELSNYSRPVMSETNLLPEPKFLPELHPTYRPAILGNRAFEQAARDTGSPVDIGIALEQADGSIFHHRTVSSRGITPMRKTTSGMSSVS